MAVESVPNRSKTGQAGRRDDSMERDRRPFRLSAGGAALNLLALGASLTASFTNSWASFNCKYNLFFQDKVRIEFNWNKSLWS